DRVGAGLTCELGRHRTDYAGRAVHQDGLPRTKAAVLEQPLPVLGPRRKPLAHGFHLAHPWAMNPTPRIIRIGMRTLRNDRWPFEIQAKLGIGKDHAVARSTLITQVSRSLVLINALGTTGILIPKALNAARMRAAWIASIHAIPASISIMYGDFNFVVSLTYPTAAPISSASASLAMLTSLSTLP